MQVVFKSFVGLAAVIAASTAIGGQAIAADVAAPATLAPASPAPAPFFFVNENRVTFSYLPQSTGPGSYTVSPNGTVDGKTAKLNYTFTHFDVWSYGTNYLNIDFYRSGHNDPASGCSLPNPGNCEPSTEVYGVLRSTFGFNEIFKTKAFTQGYLHNVSLEVGTDQSTKNIPLAPATHRFFIGPQFAFDLPYNGYVHVAPMYFKELNHNSFAQLAGLPGGNTDYRNSWAVEIDYSLPLNFLPERIRYFTLSGFFGVYGPKGPINSPLTGAAGGTPTVTELFSEPVRLTFDAGGAFYGPKASRSVEIFAAWRYWQNKFGLSDGRDPVTCLTPNGRNNGTCSESTLHTGVSLRF